MFSSQASCKEFIAIKEKIAMAIIKERADDIPDLVKEAKKEEACAGDQ
jgi:hypothetical protein